MASPAQFFLHYCFGYESLVFSNEFYVVFSGSMNSDTTNLTGIAVTLKTTFGNHHITITNAANEETWNVCLPQLSF